MPKACVSLLSGGLDSLLVLRLMAMQGLDVVALHSVNCFHGAESILKKKEKLRAQAFALGAGDIVFPDITQEVLDVTRRPKHGYGKHLNACIDCRLRTVAAGFRAMRELGADFVVTGEVVGQRPMSQRRDAIALANREIERWGHSGLLLRPLSARLLEKTVPETEGWVDEKYLFDISGRGRERQIALAREIGLDDYPSPAGGCLLTDPGFSRRLAVLMRYNPEWNADDVELLKVGRHFQISPAAKIVASRREEENYRLRELAKADDYFYINDRKNGAIVMLRGEKTGEADGIAAGLAVYFSKMREAGEAEVARWRVEGGNDVDRETFIAKARDPEAVRAEEFGLIGKDSLALMRKLGKETGPRKGACSPTPSPGTPDKAGGTPPVVS